MHDHKILYLVAIYDTRDDIIKQCAFVHVGPKNITMG